MKAMTTEDDDNPPTFLLRHRTTTIVLVNLALATGAYLVAFALRFDLDVPEKYVWLALATLPLLLACKLVGFWATGLFTGWWRYVTVYDVEGLVRGNALASILFLTAMVFGPGLGTFPRAVFVIDLIVCTGLMASVRVGLRLARERRARGAIHRVETLVLVVGAGDAGVRLVEEIQSRPRLGIAVVGFIDDDPGKIGLRICGVRVLGPIDALPTLVAAHDVGEVLIAIPSARGAVVRHIVQRCTEAGVRHRALPTLGELVEGRVIYTQMREVRVDDLLAREPVRLERPRVDSLVAGKTVLVTGAAGSIGSELCRQLAGHAPERVVLFDRHENGMFGLEAELRTRFPEVQLVPILGDVLLPDQLGTVFAAERPDIVFHAAAYKHVPLAELNVLEAVRNNVLGTRNVAEAAIAQGVKEFVLVSTDKAVRPTSVMGVSKRAAEMVVQGLQNGCSAFIAVRFGNVLGSSGSVVPLFREQIRRGGPVTVTDPEATRYFMTIPEAAQLILQAAALGNGGEIFILEMGQPVRIVDLARQMIRLSGYQPDDDIEIVYTGLRPGEKLHEELVADEEQVATTYHDRIRVLTSCRATAPGAWLPALERAVHAGDLPAAITLLRQIVPGYQPSEFVARMLAMAGGNGHRHAHAG